MLNTTEAARRQPALGWTTEPLGQLALTVKLLTLAFVIVSLSLPILDITIGGAATYTVGAWGQLSNTKTLANGIYIDFPPFKPSFFPAIYGLGAAALTAFAICIQRWPTGKLVFVAELGAAILTTTFLLLASEIAISQADSFQRHIRVGAYALFAATGCALIFTLLTFVKLIMLRSD